VIQVLDDSASVPVSQTVLQRGAGCLYSLEPDAVTVPSAGAVDGRDGGAVTIRARTDPADCSWTARTTVPWMMFAESRLSGTGDGEVFLSVLANSTPATRLGELVVAGLSGLNPDARVVFTQTGR